MTLHRVNARGGALFARSQARHARTSVLLLGVALAWCRASSAASLDPGAMPAEYARLASQSLLIDVAQAGARLVAVGERGHILLSDDQGRSWRQAQTVPTQNLLTGVCFADERRGIAVGHDEIILTTVDAGETWTRRHYAPEAQQPLLDVLCNGQSAIAVGAYSAYFSSSDFGATWTERKFTAATAPADGGATNDGATNDGVPEDFHLNRIAAASGSRVYIAAEAGHLYRSDDAGATWKALPSPYEGSFFGVLPLSVDSVVAYGLRGHLYRSDDAGATWRRIETHTDSMLNDAVRLPTGGIAVVGLSGTVLRSDDGERFALAQQSDRKGLSAVLPAGASNLVTVGEGGVKRITRSPAP